MKDIESIAVNISYLSAISPLLPIIYYVSKKRKPDKVFRIVMILLIVSFLAEGANEYFIRVLKIGQIVLNIFFVVQFFLLSWIYSLLLTRVTKVFFRISEALFSMTFIGVTLFYQDLYIFQNAVWSVGSVLIIIYSVRFYLYSYDIRSSDIQFNKSFWLNSAIFFYFSMNFWVILASHYFFYNLSINSAMMLWTIHNLNNIIRNALFTVAFHWAFRTQENFV